MVCITFSPTYFFSTFFPPPFSSSPLYSLLFPFLIPSSYFASFSLFPSLSLPLSFPQDLCLYNSSVLKPRVVGEWVGREEDDSDPLAAEMLQPPVPRAKTESWGSEENSPAGR